MDFEKIKTEEKKLIYPERVPANMEDMIETLRKMESGEISKINLNEEEKKGVLGIERKLGEDLEQIYSIKVTNLIIYPEYLLTEEGKKDFQETAGVKIEGRTVDEIKKFLCDKRSVLASIEDKKRSALIGRAVSFSDSRLLAELEKNIDANGILDIGGIKAPDRISLIVNPDKALDKIKGLRKFKEKVKKILGQIEKSPAGNIKEVERGIIEIYRRRTNELLATDYHVGVSLKKMEKYIGTDGLSESEKEIEEIFKGLQKPEVNYSRVDKFIYGAGKEYNVSGMREQISQEIKNYADEIGKLFIEAEVNKKASIEKSGLDYEKINKKDINVSKFTSIAEETLSHYGEKSVYSSHDYNPNREGPAPDGKWQFVARPEFKVMAVDGFQKVIKSQVLDKSIIETLSVMNGHEIEGHFIQAINKSKIPLKLIEKVGADRTHIFAEGGAMFVQGEINEKAFGFHSTSHPHYVRAMITRLEGGNYLSCVKSFFESAYEVIRAKREAGVINDREIQEEIEYNLKLAINRSKRLFREEVDFNEESSMLTRSRDTAYLEQLMLLDKLKKASMEKYAFVGGVNLETLILLNKLSLVDLEKIKSPDYYTLKIWEKMKDQYKK